MPDRGGYSGLARTVHSAQCGRAKAVRPAGWSRRAMIPSPLLRRPVVAACERPCRHPSHCLYLRCRVARLFWSCRAVRPCQRLRIDIFRPTPSKRLSPLFASRGAPLLAGHSMLSFAGSSCCRETPREMCCLRSRDFLSSTFCGLKQKLDVSMQVIDDGGGDLCD